MIQFLLTFKTFCFIFYDERIKKIIKWANYMIKWIKNYFNLQAKVRELKNKLELEEKRMQEQELINIELFAKYTAMALAYNQLKKNSF